MAKAFFLDTLAYANRLKEVGVPAKQAEVQAELLAEVLGEKLATKHDLKLKLANLKNELIQMGAGRFRSSGGDYYILHEICSLTTHHVFI